MGDGAAGPRLALCAAGVLLAAALPALLSGRRRAWSWQLLAATLAALGLLLLREVALHGGPRQPGFADHWADGSLRELPARSVVIASAASAARLQRTQRLEGARPDVTALSEAALGQARHAEALAAAEPTLKGLLRTRLIDGQLSSFELQSLAAQRPVYVERDATLPQGLPQGRAAREHQAELDETVVPEGAYARVQTSAVADNDVAAAAVAQREHYERLEARVALSQLDGSAADMLRARHVSDALYFLRASEQRGTLEALERALTVQPGAALAERLLRAAESVPEGQRFDGQKLLQTVGAQPSGSK
jgi:hypothetical protein